MFVGVTVFVVVFGVVSIRDEHPVNLALEAVLPALRSSITVVVLKFENTMSLMAGCETKLLIIREKTLQQDYKHSVTVI